MKDHKLRLCFVNKMYQIKKEVFDLSDDLIYDEFVDINGKCFINIYKDESLPKDER